MKLIKYTILCLFLVFAFTACTKSENEVNIVQVMKDFESQTSYKVIFSQINNPTQSDYSLVIEKDQNKVKILDGYLTSYEEHFDNTLYKYTQGVFGYGKKEYNITETEDRTVLLKDFKFSSYKYSLNENGYYIITNSTGAAEKIRIKVLDNKVSVIYLDLHRDGVDYQIFFRYSEFGNINIDLPNATEI